MAGWERAGRGQAPVPGGGRRSTLLRMARAARDQREQVRRERHYEAFEGYCWAAFAGLGLLATTVSMAVAGVRIGWLSTWVVLVLIGTITVRWAKLPLPRGPGWGLAAGVLGGALWLTLR